MLRCCYVEFQTYISDNFLLAIDIVSISVIAFDLFLKLKISRLSMYLLLDVFILMACLLDSVVIFYFTNSIYNPSPFLVLRIYFLIKLSDSTFDACINSVLCLREVISAISIQIIAWFFFSCLCAILFGLSDPEWRDLPNALVNMFALTTTSNNPDVWLHMFAISRWNSLLFLSYLFISVFFLQNYVAVTVYAEFSSLVRETMQQKYKQRQNSLLLAFQSIDTNNTGYVEPNVIINILKYFRPQYDNKQINILYDCIDKDKEGSDVSFEKFVCLLDALAINISIENNGFSNRITCISKKWRKRIYKINIFFSLSFVILTCYFGKQLITSTHLLDSFICVVVLTVFDLISIFSGICASKKAPSYWSGLKLFGAILSSVIIMICILSARFT